MYNKAENTNQIEQPSGEYWNKLKSLGLPNYLHFIPEDKTVIILGKEKRKRKKGGKINQVYYILEDGRVKHASFFRKVDIKVLNRDSKINQILNND